MSGDYLSHLKKLEEEKEKAWIIERLLKEYEEYLGRYSLAKLRELERRSNFAFGERE